MTRDTRSSDELPAPLLVVVGLSLIMLIGLFEYSAPLGLSLALLYLVPLFILARYVGAWAGVAGAVISVVPGFVAGSSWGTFSQDPVVRGWNLLVQLSFFLIFVYLVTEVKNAVARVANQNAFDPVAGVGNARRFFDAAEAEIESSRRGHSPFTVAYLDVDGLGGVNDRLGRAAGDALLGLVGRTCDGDLRKADVVARLGGDEFALLLPRTNQVAAETVVRRLQDTLVGIFRSDGWPVTVSIGVVTFPRAPASVDDLLRQAEAQMRAAKAAGPAQVSYAVWSEPAVAA